MAQYKINQPNQEYKLNIGDRLVVEDNLLFGLDIVYAGKPTDNKFALLFAEREFLSTRTQGNLFFPTTQKNLRFGKKELEVLVVEDNSILLKYIK